MSIQEAYAAAEAGMRVVELNVEDEADARPPEYSDEALALRFGTARAEGLRYIAAWGRWFEWSGVVWAQDDTLAAYDMIRHECRAAAAEITARDTSATAKRQAANVASAKAVAAVERLTRSDRRLAATVSQWDSGREVFTTPGATIDLRTGENRPARREDYSTKCSAVAPMEMVTPLWDSFSGPHNGGRSGRLPRFEIVELQACEHGSGVRPTVPNFNKIV